jgi:hypothetical protein
MKVFLGGTCESDWRDAFIPLLDIDYFNPIVDNWTEACKVEELNQRQTCDFLLYVITPSMKGVYSIAEVTDDSNKKPHRTILVVLKKDDGESFSADETKSLKAVQELVERNGGQVFNSLKPAADWINQEATAMTYAREETVDGRQVELCVDDIEGALTEVGSLESLLEAIEESRDVGMEAWSAQFAKIHVSGVMRRYRLDPCDVSLPAMESFYDARRARLSTSISMESVKETIQKVWKWIKEKMKQILEMLSHFWHRLISSLDYVEKEATELKHLALTTHTTGHREIHLPPTLAAKLASGKKVPGNLQSILTNLQSIEQLNHVPKETLDLIYKRITAQFDWYMQSGGKIPYKAEVLVPQGWVEVVSPAGEERYVEGELRTFVSPTLPGNVTIQISAFGLANQEMSKDNETGKYVSYRPEVVKLDVGDIDTEVMALGPNEVATLCDTIIHIVRRMKESRRAIDAHMTNVSHDIDRMAERYLRGNNTQYHRDYMTVMRNVYHTCVVYGTKLTRTCESVAFDVLAAHLSFAKRSLEAADGKQVRLALPSLAH